jgi:hypothetical protein
MLAPIALAALAFVPQSVGVLAERGGGRLEYGPGAGRDCISPEERAAAERTVKAWFELRPAAKGALALSSSLYTFYPMGGRLYRDIFINNFNDLDPTAGILDWDCGNRTYNGHDATDTELRSFGEQAIGVPIYAALDGTVISTHDGEPDMNTSCTGTANHVIIDHGGGRVAYYWHMKKGSVAVSTSEVVKAGQQIGLVASSGCSTAPHLHFASYQGGVRFEPYTGPCNAGPSGWTNQEPIDYTLFMHDFGVSETTISGTSLPSTLPRSSHWAQTNTTVYFWTMLKGLPANSTYVIRFKQPDGNIAFNSGTLNFSNPVYYRQSWWWWGYNIANMKTMAGTWEIRLKVNGTVLIDAPVEVTATSVPGFNRAPAPITASFVPACPSPSDVLRCEVGTDLVLDDPDWDIVSYRYLWRVNGAVVRDVTTAGHMDALPHSSWSAGDVVTCEVTPKDGLLDGPTVIARFPDASTYCTAGTTASGCNAAISSTGVPSLSAASGFVVSVATIEGDKDGILFFGANGHQANAWGSGTSFQCVVPPVKRTGLQNGVGTPGACDGSYALDFNAWMAANPTRAPAAGEEVSMQAWFRDPQNTGNQTTSLSDAVRFGVCP